MPAETSIFWGYGLTGEAVGYTLAVWMILLVVLRIVTKRVFVEVRPVFSCLAATYIVAVLLTIMVQREMYWPAGLVVVPIYWFKWTKKAKR